MTDSDTKEDSIYTRLLAVQSGLKVPKLQEGRFGKSRNVEDILNQLKPLLGEHELTLTIDNEIEQIGDKNYIKATAAVHSAGGKRIGVSAYALEGEITRGLDAPQVTGSATSYARKYALGGLFAIDDGKDDPDRHKDAPSAPGKPKLATGPQKFQLQKLMKENGIDEADQMIMFIESVISKKRVETQEDYNNVKAALEDEAPNE